MPIATEKNLEELSPFELSLFLEKKVHKENKGKNLLNAGRGNPNWTAPTPREAFFLLGQFATQETLHDNGELTAGMITAKEGRSQRFIDFLTAHPGKGSNFLKKVWYSDNNYLGLPKEDWLTEMLDHIIGDNYPNPVRCLTACEGPIKAYLNQELFADSTIPFDIFAVEGGTAGICYMFDTLMNNFLLHQGDKIALMLPTFAPYLEIPELPQYDFDVVKIQAQQTVLDGKSSYQFPDSEINKLRDTTIKAVFVVNPSNPTANAICQPTIDLIKEIVATDHKDLMILTDDVYGTFVPTFKSLFAELPYNTACIYSYSKYFGATGWRVGTIAVARDSIFDQLIAKLPDESTAKLAARYASVSSDPGSIPFIDRIVADSRDVALNHAAGLSSPQQVMMTLFSLYSLMDEGQAYKDEVMAICHEREKLLFHTLGLEEPLASLDTAYYCEIDFEEWVRKRYGQAFATYLKKSWTVTKILTILAEKEQLMLLKANAFGSGEWAVRVSLANLSTNQYAEVGERIIHLTESIRDEWLKETK